MNKAIKRPLYDKMNGILYPAMFSPKCFREVLDYKPKSNDVFIVTYPKCGTTWMQTVVLNIFRKGKELEDTSQFLKYCPFIDMLGLEGIKKMPRPGAFKTHLSYNHMPLSSEAKYVFVSRNPKDCCMSFYYHARNEPAFGYWDGKFDDFFELFMAGELEYNDYFDHLLSWYPHRNEPNIFYTTYEDMKKDIKKIIVKLAAFFGQEYIDAIEKDNLVLNNIVFYSSFDYMKKNLSEIYDLKSGLENNLSDPSTFQGIKHISQFMLKLDIPEELPQKQFIRKGIVGDWKNSFTEEQRERLDKKFFERTKGTDIPNWFSV